jgi:hypothetical protein
MLEGYGVGADWAAQEQCAVKNLWESEWLFVSVAVSCGVEIYSDLCHPRPARKLFQYSTIHTFILGHKIIIRLIVLYHL